MARQYANAPLASATFEVRFDGDLTIQSKKGDFQKAVQTDYPKLFVPSAVIGKAPALQHDQLRTRDDSSRVSIAVNSFAFATTRYLGFETFKKELFRLWKVFSGFFEIPTFNRLGLRYINNLPIVRDKENMIPLGRYLRTHWEIAKAFPSPKISNIGVDITSKLRAGDLKFLVQNQRQVDGSREILVLDMDFFQEGKLKSDVLPEFVDVAHAEIERLFFRVISEEYKQAMKGKKA